MPTKLFIPNTVAYASDVNTYLMQQAIVKFTTPTQRNQAWGDGVSVAEGGDGLPELLPGQFCYLSDRDGDGSNNAEVQYWDGDSWVAASTFSLPDEYVTNTKVSPTAAIVDTKLATISTADKVAISALNIDGATDIGAALADSDIFIVDDGGAGTNRKASVTRIFDYIYGKTNATPTFASISISGSASITGNTSLSGSLSVSGNVVSHAIPEIATSLTNAIDGKIVKVSSSVALTTTGGSWTNGTQFTIINTSAAALTITASTGTTFLAAPLSGSNVKLRAQYSTATFIYEQGTGWYVIGDLTST